MNPSHPIIWKIDECAAYFDRMHVSGWCVCASNPVRAVGLRFDQTGHTVPLHSFGRPSPDVAAQVDLSATQARFDEWITAPETLFGTPFSMQFLLADGSIELCPDGLTNAAWGDAYYQSWENFLQQLEQGPSGPVLEIGSRARSAISRRHRISPRFEYVGLDLLAGPNVDVIGDAHALTELFPSNHFVAAFSASVFEHLLAPWKVAIELNHILKPGGLVYTSTHQTWPLHEEPCDFWRYSRDTWRALFNPDTGFSVLEAVMGEPARVHACRTSEVTRDMPKSPAYLGCACLAQKTTTTVLNWPRPGSAAYPAGQLAIAPSQDPT